MNGSYGATIENNGSKTVSACLYSECCGLEGLHGSGLHSYWWLVERATRIFASLVVGRGLYVVHIWQWLDDQYAKNGGERVAFLASSVFQEISSTVAGIQCKLEEESTYVLALIKDQDVNPLHRYDGALIASIMHMKLWYWVAVFRHSLGEEK
ncbi:hypothetical protein VNO78_18423 [Psophocarpus tetragonolobus]|uniref:Uncharacterized protein n=1 Tax=Psophocarpus tetragonolobus TaxID=3891 RepID=A0AAN9XM64_PSOTE